MIERLVTNELHEPNWNSRHSKSSSTADKKATTIKESFQPPLLPQSLASDNASQATHLLILLGSQLGAEAKVSPHPSRGESMTRRQRSQTGQEGRRVEKGRTPTPSD